MMEEKVNKISEEKITKITKYVSPDGKVFKNEYECLQYIKNENKKEKRISSLKNFIGIKHIPANIDSFDYLGLGRYLYVFFADKEGNTTLKKIDEIEDIKEKNLLSAGWYFIKDDKDLIDIKDTYETVFNCCDKIFEGRISSIRGWVFVVAGKNHDNETWSTYFSLKELKEELKEELIEKEVLISKIKETCKKIEEVE